MARTVVKDRAAETDLIDIWVYSFEQWSEEQADRYLDHLEAVISALARDPQSGKDRESLRTGYWSKAAQRHVVFYTFTDAELRVRRVLHQVMDFDRHLT